MREEGSMQDYITNYCTMLESKFKEQNRLERLETQITASEFSSLTEVSYRDSIECWCCVARYHTIIRPLEESTCRWE